MSDFEKYIKSWPNWIECDDVVLWNNVQLKRNVSGYKFPIAADAKQNEKIYQLLSKSVTETCSMGEFIELEKTDFPLRKYLKERFFIDPYMVANPHSSGVFISENHDSGIQVNFTSHLKFFNLKGGKPNPNNLDILLIQAEEIGQNYPYSYSNEFGYMMPFIEDCGTAMKIVYFLRLPGFILYGKFAELRNLAREFSLEVNPHSFGENNLFGTGIFAVSNLHTLGMDTEDLLEQMQIAISTIEDKEREYRQKTFPESRSTLEDKIMKTIGMLKYSKEVSSNEFGKMLFSIMLGMDLGIIPISIDQIIQTAFSLSPAYLEYQYSEDDDELLRQMRAKSLQNLLQNI